MPETHSSRVTDTATMIPDKIPIPMASIDDHLRTTMEHLITLLINKRKHIGPLVKSTTQSELLRLAQILQRDTKPKLTPLPSAPTSDGVPTKPSVTIDNLPSLTSTPSPSPISDDSTVKIK